MPRPRKELKPSLYIVPSSHEEKQQQAWIPDELKMRSLGALRTMLPWSKEDGGAYRGYTTQQIEAAIRYRIANDETHRTGDFY